MAGLDGIDIRPATLAEIIALRHDVLRHGLPREMAIFPGDDAPTSLHVGAFAIVDGCNVGCATFHASTWEGQAAWQLRGMATHETLRGRGLGRAMLGFAEPALRERSNATRVMWCNARVPAVGFYESVGWAVVSDVFDVPSAGPHRRMIKAL